MSRWNMIGEVVQFEHLCSLHMSQDDYREMLNSAALFFDDNKARNSEGKYTFFNQRLFSLPYSELRIQKLKSGIRSMTFFIDWLPISGPVVVVEFSTALVFRRTVIYRLH